MIHFSNKIHVYRDHVDMRKSLNGLLILVAADGLDLMIGCTFLFVNRNRDKIKILVREDNGFVLIYKRLDKGGFRLSVGGKEPLILTSQEARWLLDGLDWQHFKRGKKDVKKHYF